MTEIKFGTDGWRAVIAKEYTVDNVARVAEATAQWLLKNYKQPKAVIGHDTRFGGQLFAETTAKVLCKHGIIVYLAEGFASTPMVSLGTVKQKADLGIIITASHNPPSYNGFKLKGSYGGPLVPEKIEEIQNLIPEENRHNLETLSLAEFEDKDLLKSIDLETIYCNHLETHFDLNAIRKSGLSFAYDAMFGAGQNVINRLLPDTALLHCENNPSFQGQVPEPIDKNLKQFSTLIKVSKIIHCGLATDGDADRLGLYDSEGNFIDSNHIILLLIKYLSEEKKLSGKVITSFSVSPKIGKMCEHFKLEQETTKIGFKYIAGKMAAEDVLLGGEESGGIAIKGHIPERDGIWIGLTIWEYMAKSEKSLQSLIKDVYAIVGPFSFGRADLHPDEILKNKIMENCKNNIYKNFGDYKVIRTENMDGYKYFFENNEWILIRASGTEPVLRIYAESSSAKKMNSLLKAAEHALLYEKHGKDPNTGRTEIGFPDKTEHQMNSYQTSTRKQ
ncbi:MAG TPA: phosphoglucomutase/phosphomannomutase family protein [Bacteroidia bacterium]|jgi:phosphomannomutase|nr:phosphoglucomutase/phosphomannomutase family protein [Bacteroidia bacterium]